MFPRPSSGAIPFNEVVTVQLNPGEQATVTFEPVQSVSRFQLPVVAISKFPQSSYEVRADGQQRFGPAGAPPTDPDDMAATFLPALEFSDELEVTVSNLAASSTARTYIVQPVGWEPMGGDNGA
ncbi:hypothetical protein BRC71_06335 [Halobacteriales archaeon QH_7_65_31]|nr:MAG: hypothetical protein BRC71_06335 [Halobacteriales archaeon QH_7_65_31]